MSTLPLVSHDSPDGIIAWHANGAVKVRDFLAEVYTLAAHFPDAGNLLNMCSNRYHFSVGLAAAIVTGKVSLLPSTHTPGVIRQIKAFAPDVFCLTDCDTCNVDLPQLRYPATDVRPSGAHPIPCIDSRQFTAIV